MIQIGIKGTAKQIVSDLHTAQKVGSGGLAVLSTPSIVALMEQVAWQSVQPYIELGADTVGTFIELNHIAPTPTGMNVWCESELIAVNGRELTFQFKVFDECCLIASGIHKRFIITADKFQQKADLKRSGDKI